MVDLLWLSAETPDVNGGGGQRRQYHQISALLASGLEIVVATLAGAQDDAAIRTLVPVERFSNSRFRGRKPSARNVIETAAPGSALVAHVESASLVERGLRDLEVPFMIDFQNVTSRWCVAIGDTPAAAEWRARESVALAAAACATACSAEEKAALLDLNTATPIEVAPNGVDPGEWPAHLVQTRRESAIAFFGSWAHQPNRIAAEWLSDEIWPRIRSALPNSRLLLFGPGEPPSTVVAQEGITAMGRTPSLAEALGRVAVAVVPIRTGIGARVKFVESLASGTPVVSTSAGSEGFDADGAYIRADAPDDFAEACITLLRDPAPAAELGRRGRDAAFSQYTWKQVSEPLLQFASTSRDVGS